MEIFGIVLLSAIGSIVLLAIALSFFTVQQQTIGVIERFGKFLRMADPGLGIKIPFVDRIAGRPSLRVIGLPVEVETKTEDNVFVRVKVSVQYQILADKVYEAFYKLNNPEAQIQSYVFDVIRARVPEIKLDDVFQKKDDVADAVKKELTEIMSEFGYNIVKSLITDIDPDSSVKESMNKINEAQRLRLAATEKGEAEKILMVKAAEAESKSKALQGEGIANQRKAIIDGLRESVDTFKESVDGASAQDVMNLVLMTQYFDTLKDIGAQAKSNTILIPHSPGNLTTISEQIRDVMITSGEVGKAANSGAGAPEVVSEVVEDTQQ